MSGNTDDGAGRELGGAAAACPARVTAAPGAPRRLLPPPLPLVDLLGAVVRLREDARAGRTEPQPCVQLFVPAVDTEVERQV